LFKKQFRFFRTKNNTQAVHYSSKEKTMKRTILTLVSAAVITAVYGTAQTTETLRSLADARGMYMGTAVSPIFYDTSEPDYAKVLTREYNMIVAENIMKWSALSSGRGKFSFSAADGMIAFAQANKLAVRGHTLVWHESLPSWVLTIKDKDEMREVLKTHVQTVAAYFKGRVFAWDVLNEAILEDGSYRKTPFYNLLGPEYIADVFRWAREADPEAKLFYNDFNSDGINPKSTAIYELVKSLKASGVPIDGVGFQAHLDSTFDVVQQRTVENYQRFRDLGLEVQLTEVDVTLSGTAPREERLVAQAKVYKELLGACLRVKCSAFITWGFTDAFSWRAGGAPLPFDSDYQPKPAYFAMIEALKASAGAAVTTPTAPVVTAPTTPAVTAPTAPTTPIVTAPTTPVATTPTATSILEFARFTSTNQSVQGGAIVKTEYSEKAGDSQVTSLRSENGVVIVDYKLTKQAGSSYAGAGVGINALADGKTVDAKAFTALRLQVASSQATSLRIRISSNDPAIINAGCYPVFFLTVTPELKSYTIPLEKFAPLGYCGANARSIAQVIGSVFIVEVADEGIPNSGVRQGQIQVGTIEFVQ
jgi:endo-1,4-beta-xylanase